MSPRGPYIKDIRTGGGEGGYLKSRKMQKQKNADMGEGGVLPIRTSFFKMPDLAISGPSIHDLGAKRCC